MKPFLEIDFTLKPKGHGRDILLALLDNIGYDSFQETPEGLKAYVLEDDFDQEELESLFIFKDDAWDISYSVDKLENKNWNEEWETHYEPIDIDGKVYIRAPFHSSRSDVELEVLITPKMSFGTGHHQTTRLMTRLLLQLDVQGKKLLDMGTGTGILAIVAEKRGASGIDAIDNFEWAVENTAENALANDCSRITAIHGDADALDGKHYQVVVANINRNVLLEDMKTYCKTLSDGGDLLISGFFEVDFDQLHDEATALGARLVRKINEGPWAACHYEI